MKLNYITFMVRDIEKTLRFYQDLAKLHVVRRFNPGKGEIVFMSNGDGETMLEFVQFEGVQKVEAIGMTMSFKAADELSALRDKARTLGCEPSEIVDQPPKPAHFTVLDPDGVRVEFCL